MKRLLAICALVCALTGCGTVQNLTRHNPLPTSYGGVEIAAERLRPDSQNDGVAQPFAWPLYAADVVVSAIGDTVALPATIAFDVKRAINNYYFPPEKPRSNKWREFRVNQEEMALTHGSPAPAPTPEPTPTPTIQTIQALQTP